MLPVLGVGSHSRRLCTTTGERREKRVSVGGRGADGPSLITIVGLQVSLAWGDQITSASSYQRGSPWLPEA